MAITNVKGTVDRVFYDGKGASVSESFNVKGRPVTKRWSCWFDQPHGLTIGEQVEVSGMHRDEIKEFEKDGELKRYVERSLNGCRVQSGERGGQVQRDEAPSWTAAPSGGGVDDYADSTPF